MPEAPVPHVGDHIPALQNVMTVDANNSTPEAFNNSLSSAAGEVPLQYNIA